MSNIIPGANGYNDSWHKSIYRELLNQIAMQLSFIVVTYQRSELLNACLESIYQQENLPRPYEVIVIDNAGDVALAPPPDSEIMLRIERPATNLGAAGGRNLGMELAQGDYWVFIDDDARWHQPDDVAKLIQILETRPQCGAVAVKSINPKTGKVITSELPHRNKRYVQALTEPVEAPYFYAYGYALRASAIQKVGNYPARYFIYMEEIDLSFRLIDAGYQIIFDPSIAVIHHKSTLGRPIQGADFWRQSTLNKSRLGWRLLPYPYPLTILFFWSLRILINTANPRKVWQTWRALWQERKLLQTERHPLKPETCRYLQKIGARLLF